MRDEEPRFGDRAEGAERDATPPNLAPASCPARISRSRRPAPGSTRRAHAPVQAITRTPARSAPVRARSGRGNRPAHRIVVARMMSAPLEPSRTPPEWPQCGHGATEDDPVAYLAALAPGADLDHRGTSFTDDLLDRLLDALRDPTTELPHLGAARFGEAVFTGEAWFDRATFTGYAWFDEATFGGVSFLGATFATTAGFTRAAFSGAAWFEAVTFASAAAFGGTVFSGAAWFVGATFAGAAQFPGAAFVGDARFDGARFEAAPWLGPLVCGGTVKLDRAVFTAPVTMMIVTRKLSLRRTRWASAAALGLRHAEVDLVGAVLEYPVTVAAEPAPFTGTPGPSNGLQGLLSEEMPAGEGAGVRLRNLSGVDAAHLALTDVDLTRCRFAGAVHLD